MPPELNDILNRFFNQKKEEQPEARQVIDSNILQEIIILNSNSHSHNFYGKTPPLQMRLPQTPRKISQAKGHGKLCKLFKAAIR